MPKRNAVLSRSSTLSSACPASNKLFPDIPVHDDFDDCTLAMATKRQIHIDLPKLRKDAELFEAGTRDQFKNEIVIVIGCCRSGKTTLMNILAHKDIEVKRTNGTYTVDVVGGDYAGTITAEGFKRMIISHGHDASTTFPNYIIVGGRQFWDCPGFGDNRGSGMDISNAYCVHKVLRTAMSDGGGGVKFVIVQDADGIGVEGGKTFKDCIKTLCKMFKPNSRNDYVNLIDATTFVFNKVSEEEVLSHDEFTPELYIADVIAKLTSQLTTENELETGPYEVRACAKYIREMQNRSTQIRHVELPRAFWDSGDMAAFSGPILSTTDGVLSKVASCVAFQSSCIAVAVSDETNMALKVFSGILRQEVHKDCETLATVCQKMWEKLSEKEGKDRVTARITELLEVLRTVVSRLKDGGATSESVKLVNQLEKYTDYAEESYKATLCRIKQIIQLSEILADTTEDQHCVSYFTDVADCIITSATGHISKKKLQEFQEYNEKLKAANRAWWNGVIQCGTGVVFIAVAGGLAIVAATYQVHILDPAVPIIFGTGCGLLQTATFSV